MIYEDRSDSEKWGIEEKQKIIVLQISANKCFLCSGIHFYEKGNYFSVIVWSFSKIMEILVKNVKKTADGIKLFLAIFEKTYYGLYMCHFFVAVACLCQK